MLDQLRDLYRYNRWANDRLLEAVSRLTAEELTRDLGNSFPSVRDTLAHILLVEWVWLRRWQGDSPSGPPGSWNLSDLAGIRARWAEVERDRAAFLAGLTVDDLDRVLPYRTIDGTAYENSLRQMLTHVVNHSTYHRGQLVTLLRQLGAEAVATDLIAYYREQDAAAATASAG